MGETHMHTKALILGGRTGLLGQALTNTLKTNNWDIICLDKEDGDVTDCAFLAETIARHHPQYIFNTIAWTQVDAAEDNPQRARELNHCLPANLGRVVAGTSMLLFHYSTDFVFSGTANEAYTEQDTPAPTCVYGTTKLQGEEALRETVPHNSCVIRTAWLFGPHKKNFITTILAACAKKDAISVVHDQVGSPTYTLDLAHWSLLLAQKNATGIFHAVNGGRASWCELACEAIALADVSCRVDPISSDQWPQKAPRPAFSVLDTTHLTQTLGIKPRPWAHALRQYIFQENLQTSSHIIL